MQEIESFELTIDNNRGCGEKENGSLGAVVKRRMDPEVRLHSCILPGTPAPQKRTYTDDEDTTCLPRAEPKGICCLARSAPLSRRNLPPMIDQQRPSISFLVM